MTESTCGVSVVGDDGKSLGITQLQISTLRYLATKDKLVSKLVKVPIRALKTKLVKDSELSIVLTIRLFHYYLHRYGYFQAISRYNGGKKNYKYFNKVMRYKKEFLNDKNKTRKCNG